MAAQGQQRKHAIPGKQMDDPARIALIGDHPGELIGDTQPALRLGQQHDAAVGTDPPAVERSADLLASQCWQVEGQGDILIDESLLLLDRRALAVMARGIMPNLRLSDYVRLIARADEAIR